MLYIDQALKEFSVSLSLNYVSLMGYFCHSGCCVARADTSLVILFSTREVIVQ